MGRRHVDELDLGERGGGDASRGLPGRRRRRTEPLRDNELLKVERKRKIRAWAAAGELQGESPAKALRLKESPPAVCGSRSQVKEVMSS
jgi:hypothetical protein